MTGTLDLWQIVEKWKDILQNSEKLENYCQDKYGKSFKIFMGADPKEPPGENMAPYIMIIPGSKEEGGDVGENTYTVFIHTCICQGTELADGKPVTGSFDDEEYKDAKVYIVPGEKEIVEFSQLIFEELQDNLEEHPISENSLDVIVGTTFPQFASLMTMVTRIEPAMGEELIY